MMKRYFAFTGGAGLGAALLFFPGEARAELPGQNVATQTPTATPLPLSGRSTQNGSVTAIQTPTPGTTTSVNTLNTSVQTQGAYSGSVSGASRPFSGKLSFKEAIERGLAFNLGQVGLEHGVRQARGQMRVVRSALLPNLNSSLTETVQQTNLRALGVRINTPFPGFSIPSVAMVRFYRGRGDGGGTCTR